VPDIGMLGVIWRGMETSYGQAVTYFQENEEPTDRPDLPSTAPVLDPTFPQRPTQHRFLERKKEAKNVRA
jgi:hypothetical protein